MGNIKKIECIDYIYLYKERDDIFESYVKVSWLVVK